MGKRVTRPAGVTIESRQQKQRRLAKEAESAKNKTSNIVTAKNYDAHEAHDTGKDYTPIYRYRK